jgi:hypothetical protein
MKTTAATLAALLTALTFAGAPALARDQDHCNAGPRDQWKPIAELATQLTAEGFKLEKIEIDDGCYEVEARDKDGWKVESTFHPVTLQRVR